MAQKVGRRARLAGGWLTASADEEGAFIVNAFIPTPATFGPFTFDRFVTSEIHAKYEEIAAFGSATIKFGDRFDITAGGRYSHNEQEATTAIIQLGNGAPQTGDSQASSGPPGDSSAH